MSHIKYSALSHRKCSMPGCYLSTLSFFFLLPLFSQFFCFRPFLPFDFLLLFFSFHSFLKKKLIKLFINIWKHFRKYGRQMIRLFYNQRENIWQKHVYFLAEVSWFKIITLCIHIWGVWYKFVLVAWAVIVIQWTLEGSEKKKSKMGVNFSMDYKRWTQLIICLFFP